MAKGKAAAANKSAEQASPRTLVLDHGAHTIKAGFATAEPSTEQCHIVTNCVARSQRDKITYVGPELDGCGDFGELQIRRPVEKGFIVNWEAEKAIWERTFLDASSPLHCDPHHTDLVLSEAPNAPTALQRNADEMVFEEFEFRSLYRTTSPTLNAYAPSPFQPDRSPPAGTPLECLLVVDAGHSYTTVTPLYHGRPLNAACRRLEVGGKLLTNQLKALLSRTMDVQREEWICQEIKEDVCYVAADGGEFAAHLERVWKGGRNDPRDVDASVVVDYVLPDYELLKRGFPRAHDPSKGARMRRLGIGDNGGGAAASEMVLPVGNERFAVPELLFTPSDLGMQQEGIAGTIMQCIHALPEGLWQAFLANIVVVGGTARLPGFAERVEGEVRKLLDESYLIRVALARDPVKNAWLGGARLAQNPQFIQDYAVTREEYMENGDAWTRRKFGRLIGG